MSNRIFPYIFSPYTLWGNVSSQSLTGLCNLTQFTFCEYEILVSNEHTLNVFSLQCSKANIWTPHSKCWSKHLKSQNHSSMTILIICFNGLKIYTHIMKNCVLLLCAQVNLTNTTVILNNFEYYYYLNILNIEAGFQLLFASYLMHYFVILWNSPTMHSVNKEIRLISIVLQCFDTFVEQIKLQCTRSEIWPWMANLFYSTYFCWFYYWILPS